MLGETRFPQSGGGPGLAQATDADAPATTRATTTTSPSTTAPTTRATTAPAAHPQVSIETFAVLGALSLAAVGGAWALGVFRPRSVEGPPRPSEPLEAAPLGWFAALAFVLMQTLPYALVAALLSGGTWEVGRLGLGTLQLVDAGTRVAAIALLLGLHKGFGTELLPRLGTDARLIPRGLIGLVALLIALPWTYLTSVTAQEVFRALGLVVPDAHQTLKLMSTTSDTFALLLLVVNAVVLAPILEEFLFRGHLQTALVAWTKSRWTGIVLASVIFALIHPWWTAPGIFVLSVCLGYVYERTGNLWASIFLHLGFNALSTSLFVLPRFF